MTEGEAILARMEKILADLQQIMQEAKDFKNFIKKTGSGISFLMNMVVRDDLRIAVVPVGKPIEFDTGLAWRKDQCLSMHQLLLSNFLNNVHVREIKLKMGREKRYALLLLEM